jgi:hypothetical protein
LHLNILYAVGEVRSKCDRGFSKRNALFFRTGIIFELVVLQLNAVLVGLESISQWILHQLDETLAEKVWFLANVIQPLLDLYASIEEAPLDIGIRTHPSEPWKGLESGVGEQLGYKWLDLRVVSFEERVR